MAVNYVCLALVVNWAAGKTEQVITMADIEAAIDEGMSGVRRILEISMAHLGAISRR